MFEMAKLLRHNAGVNLDRARVLAGAVAGTGLDRIVHGTMILLCTLQRLL
jgi:hypothetical protein